MDDQNVIWLERIQHDLRTPLTGILGFAKRIQAETTDPVIKNYADQLVLASKALDTFLLFQPHPKAASVCLKSVCEKVLDMSRPAASLKKITLFLQYNLSQSLFYFNESRVFHILLETISNAIQCIDKAEKREIILIVNELDNNAVQFEIRDTGIGIAESDIPYIFDLHYRGKNNIAKSGLGTGLADVKRWVNELGGVIAVESKLNNGTSFFYTIPFLAANKTEKNNIKKDDLPHVCKVLVIEDHDMTAAIHYHLLEQAGCDVDIALNGQEAIARCAEERYDVILLDLHLSDMSSQEVIDAITILSDHQSNIIGITAYQMQQDSALKIESIIQKPLQSSDIAAILKKHVLKKSDRVMVDLALGAKRIHQDEAAAKEMLMILVKELDLHKKNIQQAIISSDYAVLEASVHQLLGGLAYCGAPRLEHACIALKDALAELDSEKIKNAVKIVVFEMGLFV